MNCIDMHPQSSLHCMQHHHVVRLVIALLWLTEQGGFAKCYHVTCMDTMHEYAMKIVPRTTLIKRRAREKVCTLIYYVSTITSTLIASANLLPAVAMLSFDINNPDVQSANFKISYIGADV
jgi:hypothetical protein